MYRASYLTLGVPQGKSPMSRYIIGGQFAHGRRLHPQHEFHEVTPDPSSLTVSSWLNTLNNGKRKSGVMTCCVSRGTGLWTAGEERILEAGVEEALQHAGRC